MIKTFIISALVALSASCASPSKIVVNGASMHLTKDSDRVNPGIGLVYGKNEIGVFDNSRVRKSNSYYYQRDVRSYGPVKFVVGGAVYDNQSEYPYLVRPILGAKIEPVPGIEVGYNVADILYARLAIPLGGLK